MNFGYHYSPEFKGVYTLGWISDEEFMMMFRMRFPRVRSGYLHPYPERTKVCLYHGGIKRKITGLEATEAGQHSFFLINAIDGHSEVAQILIDQALGGEW